jgi:hypothetical protein
MAIGRVMPSGEGAAGVVFPAGETPARDAPSAPDKIDTGTMILIAEPPDILYMRMMGAISAQDVALIIAARQRLAQKSPHVFSLIDFSRSTTIPPDARKAILQLSRTSVSHAYALFGASRHITLIVSVLLRALNALVQFERPVAFFQTESEAREWLCKRRRIITSGEPHPRPTA